MLRVCLEQLYTEQLKCGNLNICQLKTKQILQHNKNFATYSAMKKKKKKEPKKHLKNNAVEFQTVKIKNGA